MKNRNLKKLKFNKEDISDLTKEEQNGLLGGHDDYNPYTYGTACVTAPTGCGCPSDDCTTYTSPTIDCSIPCPSPTDDCTTVVTCSYTI